MQLQYRSRVSGRVPAGDSQATRTCEELTRESNSRGDAGILLVSLFGSVVAILKQPLVSQSHVSHSTVIYYPSCSRTASVYVNNSTVVPRSSGNRTAVVRRATQANRHRSCLTKDLCAARQLAFTQSYSIVGLHSLYSRS